MQVSIGDVKFGENASLGIIAGPCAAESLDLCLEVASYIQEVCAKQDLGYVFKASFDKANRTSNDSGRGPGIEEGLNILAKVKDELQVPVITDIHLPEQAKIVAEVCDAIQIPAFLCRQTDLLIAAAKTNLPIQIKKGQFVAPQDMQAVVDKVTKQGNKQVMLCERGTSFGYHNLVVDMRSLAIMRETNCPIVFDATHSTQLPSANNNESGGDRKMALILARAASAVGIDGLFIETHPNPTQAISDAAVQLELKHAKDVIEICAKLSKLVAN